MLGRRQSHNSTKRSGIWVQTIIYTVKCLVGFELFFCEIFFIVGFELFFCEIFLYSDTMKYIWHLNFHSSLKESFKPSLSLPSQRRQVWYSSLRMSFHIGMAEDFNIVNLLSLIRWESESEFLHCKTFRLLIGWKVNSYMVNLLKGVWMVAVTPLPSTWSRTARNIGHLQVGSLINNFFLQRRERSKMNQITSLPPSSRPPQGCCGRSQCGWQAPWIPCCSCNPRDTLSIHWK